MRLRSGKRAPAAKRQQTAVLSVRLDAEHRRRLDRLAKATERTSSWLIQDAVGAYLDAQEWQVAAIEQSLRKADERPERAVSHERVKKWVSSWGSKRETERPR